MGKDPGFLCGVKLEPFVEACFVFASNKPRHPCLPPPHLNIIDTTFVFSSFSTSFMRLWFGSSSDFSILLFVNEAMMLSSVIVVIVLSGDFYVFTINSARLCELVF